MTAIAPMPPKRDLPMVESLGSIVGVGAIVELERVGMAVVSVEGRERC